MRKVLSLTLALLMIAALALPALAEEKVGVADGYGGPVTVTITMEGDKIVKVDIVGDKETEGIGTPVIEQMPEKIIAAGGSNVDVVTGATWTSNAIIKALKIALGELVEEEAGDTQAEAIATAEATIGFGLTNLGRIGPGKDDKDVQVYSFNGVYAGGIFDKDGRILYLTVDCLEVATPNYDGDGMPHFSGWPGQGGYNYDSDHDGKVDSVTEVTDESFLGEVASWATKRQRGDAYKMSSGTWAQEMNAFEKLFQGKTVAEVEEWFAKYTSDRNGRPLKDGSNNEQDAAKYNALSAEEKAMLADVTTSATMSLRDSHGDILGAIKAAYDNRLPVTASTAGIGFGISNLGRIGPGKDDKEVQVYSFNQIFALSLFDAEGRILQSHVDALEVASPNYDGDGMPHFSGYPGQGGYNYDSDHDGKVDSVTEVNDESFLGEVAAWATKRQRGDAYKMGTGTWAQEMDGFQKLFQGKTVEEIADWASKYASDRNGRPLKDGSNNEQDAAKYNALSAEEKAMLADVTTSATMSLNDSHGDILAALHNSYTNLQPLELTIGK